MTPPSQTSPAAPEAARVPHLEVRHGESAIDDYFWLREKSNPKVREYLEAENAYTAAMTSGLKPFEDALYKEMLARIKETDLSVPVQLRGYFYYTRTEEGKQCPIQCRRKGSMEAPEELLLNLNELAADRKFVSLGAFVVSDDQNLAAYTIDYTGFRQFTLQMKDLRTGQTLPDTFGRVTSLAWAADDQTLFLVTEDDVTKRSDKLFRHTLGSQEFEEIYTDADELYDIEISKTRDLKYLVLLSEAKDTSEARYLSASRPESDFTVFLPRERGHRYYIDHRDGLFYIRTNKPGRNFAVMTAPVDNPAPENWKTLIPHRENRRIQDIDLFRDFAVAVERGDALDHLRVYSFDTGTWRDIAFPEPVYSVFPGGTPDYASGTYRYNYQSFLTPSSVFDYDVTSAESILRKRQEVLGEYDPKQYASERLWATARDGVKVPVSVVYRKNLVRDGAAPMLLYAYGSYGYGMAAAFSSNRLSLLDRGMSYAIAHIRGGDEMGEQWREDGMLMKKKNTFYDFIDCAEFLIEQKWTSSARLAIEGRSAGGLLMGAVVNMRPDLFKAVHAAVPFVDVINSMMDATLPLTVGEYLEWGNPNEKPAYDYMKSYSPYDNLERRPYPAILVTTSFNDSQVMYWEPAKYVARLRTLKTDSNPLLLKIKMDPAGHGGASGRYDQLRDTAFEYAWILSQAGICE
ncbi:MAG TPA: S9 family peptidase [Bryobacteraceae bacterium]|jgi:oligopeptidase B|nr:S9 family peptidase [Bryobacteraceae bacterium]